MTLLSRACVSPYQYFIETISVCRTVSEIFSVEERRDLEIGGRVGTPLPRGDPTPSCPTLSQICADAADCSLSYVLRRLSCRTFSCLAIIFISSISYIHLFSLLLLTMVL